MLNSVNERLNRIDVVSSDYLTMDEPREDPRKDLDCPLVSGCSSAQNQNYKQKEEVKGETKGGDKKTTVGQKIRTETKTVQTHQEEAAFCSSLQIKEAGSLNCTSWFSCLWFTVLVNHSLLTVPGAWCQLKQSNESEVCNVLRVHFRTPAEPTGGTGSEECGRGSPNTLKPCHVIPISSVIY